ncbi:YceI family protein [Saccharomonospora cyanea]|uniref:Lipid/polyisoprenoid-binding YceI-like domain-containing protein n=1 Tax=Saccharomonospora cyanea NA-134 TaxID=882082 RepID=H5XMC5_9PSEU|nr:YceI family protein [Saccharomonospora cyanea]EHR63676.1 hypothetical protein SaccyDRAFT_4875 [Saccharomonospora cyanea NA-134]
MASGQADSSSVATPRPGHYEIDIANSTVAFTTRHLFGLLSVPGTFAISGGTANVAEPITESGVEVEIDAASFRTPTPLRDKVVRSAMYLNTARYPTITFSSKQWDGETLTGTLTVCGVASPVVLHVTESSVDEHSFTARATARVDRTDFGVTATRGMLDRYLDFTLTVRFVRQ